MGKKNMYILIFAVGALLLIWFLYSWLSIRGIEEPKYELIEKTQDYEIREYSPYIIAETVVSGAKNRDEAANMGFPIIAGYIFGDNASKSKIAMTAPVNTEKGGSEKIAMTIPVNTKEDGRNESVYKVSFVMPSQYTLETLPEPNDERIDLIEVPKKQDGS